VRPFLINLFSDPAILRVPFFAHPWFGRIIAYARTKVATANLRFSAAVHYCWD
jgi:ferrochelatase